MTINSQDFLDQFQERLREAVINKTAQLIAESLAHHLPAQDVLGNWYAARPKFTHQEMNDIQRYALATAQSRLTRDLVQSAIGNQKEGEMF